MTTERLCKVRFYLACLLLAAGVDEALKQVSEGLRIKPGHEKARRKLEALLKEAAEAAGGDTDKE